MDQAVATDGNAPLVSVIIPCYEAQAFVREALDSVSAQTYANWEIIVVEDASSDGTEAIVRRFGGEAPGRVEYLRHETNRGVSATRNTGITRSTGELVAFLDHDDLWLPAHLETSVRALLDNAADLVSSDVALSTQSPSAAVKPPPHELYADWHLQLFARNVIALSSVVMRRSAFDRVGMFDPRPEFQHCEDYDLWLRMIIAGRRFARLGEITAIYRQHEDQASARVGMMIEREWSVIQAHLPAYPAPRRWKRRRAAALALRGAMHYWSRDRRSASLFARRALWLDPRSLRKWWLVIKSLGRLISAP